VKVYFDTCCLNRPLDDKGQPRVALEAEAVRGLLQLCQERVLRLVSSEALVAETAQNTQPIRRSFVLGVLKEAIELGVVDLDVIERASELELRGFGGFDAMHLALAESVSAMYFCTCDDRLLK
jgi:predicted nucleic acid-binding protein